MFSSLFFLRNMREYLCECIICVCHVFIEPNYDIFSFDCRDLAKHGRVDLGSINYPVQTRVIFLEVSQTYNTTLFITDLPLQ